jgi:hypothetical protein
MRAELHGTALPQGQSGLSIRTRKVGILITEVAYERLTTTAGGHQAGFQDPEIIRNKPDPLSD